MNDSADQTVAAGVAAGWAALTPVSSACWSDVADDALLQVVEDAHKLAIRAEAAALAGLAELDRRGTCQVRFGIDTAAWLADKQRIARASARARVRMAGELFVDLPLVGTALAGAGLTVDHARSIGHGLSVVPIALGSAEEKLLHETLIGYCAQFTPSEVRRLTNRAVEVAAPDAFDAWQAQLLARQEELARQSRTLSWRWTDHGTLRLVAVLDAADGELVAAAINRCLSHTNDPSETGGDNSSPSGGGTSSGASCAAAEAGESSDQMLARTRAHVSPMSQRRADALVALAQRALNADPMTAPTATLATALVTFDYTTLTGDIRAAAGTLLGSHEPISPATCRSIACDAGIIPVLLNSAGQPIDRGREVRFFDHHQRMLLALRDQGCVFPGCDRPPIDCHAHHIVPWHDGGTSDLANGVLVCPHHHRLVEPQPGAPPGSRWEIRLSPDGIAEALPPASYDPTRQPRRNSRFINPA